MSEKTEQLAVLYREFAKSPVFTHLKVSAEAKATQTRKDASQDSATAFGELRYADGVEWFLSHVNQQQVLDKKGGREKSR